jgi:MFS family permease
VIASEELQTGRAEPPDRGASDWRAPFRHHGFAAASAASAAASFATVSGSVVFSWVALVVTGDPLAVGAVIAVRFVARLLFGIPAGVLADRVDRRRLVVTASLLGAAVGGALVVATAANGGILGIEPLIVGSFLLGVLDTARIAGGTAYTVDLVGLALATGGLALVNLGAQVAGIAGGAAGGYLLERFGMVAALGALTVGLLASALVLAFGPTRPRASRDRPDRRGLREAFLLVRRDPLLRALTVAVVVVEIFGFSSITLLPLFAQDVFSTGPDGYGLMTAARSLGAVLGLVGLVRIGARLTSGPSLMACGALMGVSLLAFALAPAFGVALLTLVLAGGTMGAWDSLTQAFMQRVTAEEERGAAMGLWAFAVGCGPLGHLTIGAAAREWGPIVTQVVFGAALVAFSAGLALLPRIRALR